MDKIKVREIARRMKLWNSELFERFIMERFPDEGSETYIGEWADRFLSGNPVCYMDDESKEAYLKVIKGLK